jgi:hypothetical protein
MECHNFALQLDDYLDGRLDAVRQQSIQEHLEGCLNCRRRHQHAVALQAALRTLPAPSPRPGFLDQALSSATRAAVGSARHTRRAVLGMALAASLVLGLALGVFLATQPAPAPVQTVALTLKHPETVRLMFNSAKPLPAATISLTLPENVELVGYGDRRELSWQTDLREGGNLLQLALVAHGTAKDEQLVARLSHGGISKTFRLKIEIKSAGKTGMAPVGLET